MEKKEVLCINDIGSLGEYLSKLGVVVPTDKTPESETAKVVKRLLKELDSWDGVNLSDRLNDEVGMDGMDIVEFIMKLEEELDIMVKAENLFLTEQDVANDYYGVEENDENDVVQDEESEEDDADNNTYATVSPTVGEVIAYVEWLADNNREP
jgi:acyl carrier protein